MGDFVDRGNCSVETFLLLLALKVIYHMKYIDKGEISRKNNIDKRKSWKQTNYLSVWILWWVFEKIWFSQCMEILYWDIRLSSSCCNHWQQDLLCAWWTITFNQYSWWNQSYRQKVGGPSWWCYVWPYVEWSRWDYWMECFT